MTKTYKDINPGYAKFLPSLSSFYQKFINAQIHGNSAERPYYIPEDRWPNRFENGILGCNFIDEEVGYFHYPWILYSAGHAELDKLDRIDEVESMLNRRSEDTFVLGDSGGFQVAKGIIEFDWSNFFETPKSQNYAGAADKKRAQIQNWLEHTADYSMILDVPTWASKPPANQKTKLNSFDECLNATIFNNDWFVRNAQGKTKYLNVLQGSTLEEANVWFDAVKHFPFNGWAMGDGNMNDMRMLLTRLITLRDEKLLEQGERDLIHILGTSKLHWAIMLSSIKRALQSTVNPDIEVTFDCASPFLATAYGQVYSNESYLPNSMTYLMQKAPDSKGFPGTDIEFPWESEVGRRMYMRDLCVYRPGDLNKIGKEPRTSWDSASYMLMMAHNVERHIIAVLTANNLAENAFMMNGVDIRDWNQYTTTKKSVVKLDPHVDTNLIFFDRFIQELFQSETPLSMIEEYLPLLKGVTKGSTRKTATSTNFNALFDLGDNSDSTVDDMSEEFADSVFDKLEKD